MVGILCAYIPWTLEFPFHLAFWLLEMLCNNVSFFY
uniref:Uncharacterized protein n=1 Tax=Rhizophora mucronata TaxID=61149 RepID=A0A2P2Q0J1_RHIMU